MMAEHKVGTLVEVVECKAGHRFEVGQIVAVVEVIDFSHSLVYICEDLETEDRWALTPSEIKLQGADSMAASSKFTREEIVLLVSTVAMYMTLEEATDYADFASGAIQEVTKLGAQMREEVGSLDGIRAGQMLEGIAQKLIDHKE